MTIIVLTGAWAFTVAALAYAHTVVVRTKDRQAARERDLLVNQLCNLAGRPWQEPPREPRDTAEKPEPTVLPHLLPE